MRGTADRALLPVLIGTLSAIAWIAMWQLGESPWGHWAHGGGSHAAHHALASGLATTTLPLGLTFIGGWLVMTIAMMLPTTLPFVQIFRRLTAHRSDRLPLVLMLVSGYLLAWTACGAAVFAATSAIHSRADASAWLSAHPQLPAAALLILAGAFQFSPLKYRCLDKCRSPLSFISSRWRGGAEAWQSLRLGVEHGAFCVGCCWALMLLMFVSGTASLIWMLVLGGVMAIEKNVSWGRRMSAPLGGLLVTTGLLLAVLQR
jgi:predicted metal-binding membrane protein